MRFPIKAKSKNRGQVSKVYQQPAPVKGWIADETIIGADPNGAYQLDNWFPEPNSIRLRPGYLQTNFAGNAGASIQTLMAYQASGVATVFAVTKNGVYDVTATLPLPTKWTNPSGLMDNVTPPSKPAMAQGWLNPAGLMTLGDI